MEVVKVVKVSKVEVVIVKVEGALKKTLKENKADNVVQKEETVL